MIRLFGIKGYKASGKTTVASFLKKQNIPIIILEDLYVDLLKPGTNVHKELIKYLGEDIIKKNGDLDIKALSLMSYQEKWIKDLIDDVIGSESENFITLLMDTFDKYKIDIVGIEIGLVNDDRLNKHIGSFVFVDSPYFMRVERMRNKYKFNENIINNILEIEQNNNTETEYYIDNNNEINSLNNKTIDFIKEYLQDNI